MTLALLFWILMIVWLIFGLWREYIPGQPYPVAAGAHNVLVFVLFGILGWAAFGAPIK